MRLKILCLAIAASSLSACGGTVAGEPGPEAYKTFAPRDPTAPPREYRIGPGDTLDITTFQEKDLTLGDVVVDATGNILLPLIGPIKAADLTSSELAREIAKRLGARYLRDPQVSVIVTSAVSQKVTVEGSVTQAGVFELKGEVTLLQALALARGPNRTADLGHVVIYRTIETQRQFAVFDVRAIRGGKMPDPQIQGDDLVVVPFSGSKGAFRDVLSALPALGVFAAF